MNVTLFRTLAFTITAAGFLLLLLTFWYWDQGELATRYFPDIDHSPGHHLQGLLLALPVPLHVIFIGLIIQKKHFSSPWQRFAWVGITGSGVWLGISLAVRTFWL